MDTLDLCKNFIVQHKSLTTICASCLIVGSILIRYNNVYSYWERRGVKGPKPLPFFGNLITHFIFGTHRLHRGLTKRYGKIYGIFEGTTPKLVISDPEVMRQICIKDFDVFTNHSTFKNINEYQEHFLTNLKDDHWKRVRAMMSPTFTSGKMKRMFQLLDDCAEDLVLCFREQIREKNGVVNVKDMYTLYSTNAISTCCYGLKLGRTGSSDPQSVSKRDELVRIATLPLNISIWRLLVMFTVPAVIRDLFKFQLMHLEPLADIINQVIDRRRKSKKKVDDYLQLLLDANLSNQMELDELDAQENHHAGLTKESILEDQKRLVEAAVSKEANENSNTARLVQTKYVLTDLETLSNAMLLMTVGLETTGTMLANCTYALAFHQEIQQKLYEEVKKLAEFDEEKGHYVFDYASLTSCTYLDACISETLRTMTNIIGSDRHASSDYYIEKYNVTIEKGTVVNLGFYSALNDPDYWEEPRKFNPDRFLPENRDKIVPGAYCPFGLGPRHCIGMRFSLTESKLALAKLLMNFRFEPALGSSFPPVFTKALGLTKIKVPLVVTIPRSRH